MKKKKLNLFLNIVTVCLCLCAIAIGVYSVKNASLNVSGTIGFTAHNCQVKVDVSMYGDAVDTDGNPSKTGTPRASTSARNLGSWDNSQANVGTSLATVTGSTGEVATQCYFSDLGDSGTVEDIDIVFNITNNSDYPIIATLKDVTGTNISFANSSGMNFSGDTIIASLPAKVSGTNTSTATLQLKLNIKDVLVTPGSFSIILYFERTNETSLTVKTASDFFYDASAVNGREREVDVFEGYKISDITEDDKKATRNYVEMGSVKNDDDTTTPLRWFIFAQSDSKTGAMKPVTDKIVENGQLLPKGNYWFICEYALGSSYFVDSSVQSNIYDGSMVQQYLSDGFLTAFIADSSSNDIYNKITGRTINDKESANVSTDNEGACTTSTAQKLWLLSEDELDLLNGGFSVNTYKENGKGTVYYKNILALNGPSASSLANWWLRSPVSNDNFFVYRVTDEGGHYDGHVYANFSVRPAFQITI